MINFDSSWYTTSLESGKFQSYSTRSHQHTPNTAMHDGKSIVSPNILNRWTSSYTSLRARRRRSSRKFIHSPWLVPEYVWISHKSRSRLLHKSDVTSVVIPVGGGYCSNIGVDLFFVFLFVFRRGRDRHGKVQRRFDGGACFGSFIPGVWFGVGIFCDACVGLLRIPCIRLDEMWRSSTDETTLTIIAAILYDR